MSAPYLTNLCAVVSRCTHFSLVSKKNDKPYHAQAFELGGRLFKDDLIVKDTTDAFNIALRIEAL